MVWEVEIFGTEADARAAAESEWKRIGRGAATFSLTLARGRPDLYPEKPVQLRGFKAEIDAREWVIKEVRHILNDAGYATILSCETR